MDASLKSLLAQDPATLDYETARDQLLTVVNAMESGGIALADTLALWERGEALADRCQEHLDGAKAKLDAAMQTPAD